MLSESAVSLVFLTHDLMFAVVATLVVVLRFAYALYFAMTFLLLAPFVLNFVSTEFLGCNVQLCHESNLEIYAVMHVMFLP